ncbi:MAG: hypothetical protein JW922_10290 [Paludibacteraceae bacterium]|nr:hypothetical protein [Paludibacteraceae bacterium]
MARKERTFFAISVPVGKGLPIPDDQRQQILVAMNSLRFSDMSPPEIYSTTLDEGTYLCRIRTMYRILKENLQNIQRRQSAPRHYKRTELLSTKPNQI